MSPMKIKIASVFVDDQEKAVRFYTDVLGFVKKMDMPAGAARWLTVVSPEGSEEIELLLEPNGHLAAAAYQKAIYEAGIPATMFFAGDVRAECERLAGLGVRFPVPVTETEWGVQAVFDDTCGNLILLHQG
jgi:catechol 2,3-dioxygenase-like lactoylglutathione lyase family enzyme